MVQMHSNASYNNERNYVQTSLLDYAFYLHVLAASTRRRNSTLARLELFPTIGDVMFMWLIIPIVPELIADTIASAVE